jgi:phage terminase large subunit
MQDYQIVVDPNSHNIQNELRNYKWADKKSNTPIDDYNHAIDAMGYIFTYWYMNVRRR